MRGQAVQPVDLHEISWFVHVDLIDAGAGRDLAYWQSVIDVGPWATCRSRARRGPSTRPGCTRLTRAVSVSTFGNAR
ncbi:MAG: hypothetical protein R3E53_07220 [Myxococcota bacterium]